MVLIHNHVAPRLSELDLQVARSVPPGGNWKDIPLSVPSQRLEQIRQSCARGEGSRSTYYGRLLGSEPSYTISTYFSRPGNGCHLHFDQMQDRTLSFREAARLQSFPDSFVFEGSKGAVADQIGNAVPPLLAFWLARAFKKPGVLIDLFAGAGGLALGFHWAGWASLVASDIDASAMSTFARNIHANTVVGDIRDVGVRERIIGLATVRQPDGVPRVLVGGPPCQGFSTAGNRRSRDDGRNHLFNDYCALVEAVSPDAFLFENVPGLLNMEKGAVFQEVLAGLGKVAREVHVFKVAADEYGVPQRRKRIIIVGFRSMPSFQLPSGPLSARLGRPPWVSVQEALGDLPPLAAGEDGTNKDYIHEPKSDYQCLMRGRMQAETYVAHLPARGEGHRPAVVQATTEAQPPTRRRGRPQKVGLGPLFGWEPT